jgi:hypothetical protein
VKDALPLATLKLAPLAASAEKLEGESGHL